MNFVIRFISAVIALMPVLVAVIVTSTLLTLNGIVKASLDGSITKAEQKNISTSAFAPVWGILSKVPYLDIK